MSKEKGEELFWALHSLLDAITGVNLKDLEAEAQAGSSKQGVFASSKGKAKDSNPHWEDVPFQPFPIAPLSTRPRFSHIVGSPSETSILPPSSVATEAVSLAEHPVYSSAVIAAWAAMNAPARGGQNALNLGQGGQQQVPQAGGGQSDGNGDGHDGNGNGQDGGAQAPLAYNNAAQVFAAWNARPLDQARNNLEHKAITCNPTTQNVQFAAMQKINLRLQTVVGQLTHQVNAAKVQVVAANVIARQAQAAAQGAANVDHFRPAAPPKYGDKKKGAGQWLPGIEDYL
jgi:hypothetical protein